MVTFSTSVSPEGRLSSSEAEALLKRAQSRDSTAMTELYLRYRPVLERFAATILGVRGSHQRDDIVDATFDILFKPSTRYEASQGARFEAFALCILRNECRRQNRQKARQPVAFTDYSFTGWRRTPLDVIPDPNARRPVELASWNEISDPVRAELNELPRKYRAALLSAAARYPSDDRASLARDLHLENLDTAGTWLYRARALIARSLRKALKTV